ncbi:hypothetical protein [Odoribacter lunatus]|uniref:hypothetical protein n=1 Tax=Odoribacter lunatus TaxID=2941335 RepID=UPI00203C82C8|nr:hypothetical protein [Odoribacter lunatus]
MKNLLLVLGIIVCMQTHAEIRKKEYSKILLKGDIEEVVLSNRNGGVEVSQTAGDTIHVEAIVSVVAKTQKKADELSDYIRIEEEIQDKYLSLTTAFDKSMTFDQLLAGVELNITYKVSLPKGIKLRLVNTDGNVFVDNYAGDLNLDLKSCNLRVGELTEGELSVKQTGGDCKILRAEQLNGEFKTCTVRIEKANTAQLVLKDCEGRFETIEKLNLTTEGGGMKFGEIEDMTGTSSSTKYEVQDIGNSLKMDMRMGEINVRNIHFNFSTVEITGTYSKVGLSFMEGAGYQFEFKHNKAVKTDIPKSFKLTQRPTSEKNVILETGFIGDKKYNGKVILNLRFGNMYIQ